MQIHLTTAMAVRPCYAHTPGIKKKPVIVLVAAFLLCLCNISRGQTITLSVKNGSLKTIFAEIEKQTGSAVFYNQELLKEAKRVTITVKKLPLLSFLETIFKDQPFDFRFVDNYIILTKRSGNAKDSTAPRPPGGNNRDLSDTSLILSLAGSVYDVRDGSPLSSVSVVVRGTGKGMNTNERGYFTLRNLNVKDQISFTIIGYEAVVLTAGKIITTNGSIGMKVATSELDRAVVQAYGVTSKRLATGNIGRVSGEEIRRQPVMNPLLALQGRVPGLSVTATSGHASAPVKVEIRGRNSINPLVYTEPLYVIDGVPLTILSVKGALNWTGGVSPGIIQGGFSAAGGQSPLFGLNPMDIESIEVLKDGDATAIYGSRAANGVILITTKKAKPGKTSFNMQLSEGVSFISRRLNLLDTKEYLAMRREAFRNDGIAITAQNAPDLVLWDSTRNANWQDEVLAPGRFTTISATLSGGDIKNSFSLSSHYSKDKPMGARSGGNQVATVRANVVHSSPDKKLSVVLNADYTYSLVDGIIPGSDIIKLPPNAPAIFDEKGNLNYAAYNASNMQNSFPFSNLLKPIITKTNTLNSSLNIGYELIDGLTLSVLTGFKTMQNTSDWFTPIASQNPVFNPTGSAVFGRSTNVSWLMEPRLSWSHFISRGRLEVQVAAKLDKTVTTGATTYGNGYTNDDLIHSLAGAASIAVQEGKSQYKYGAVFARINYNWDNKYILNLNGNRDGSSRFGPGRQFGNFGSVGLAWIASQETWIKKHLPEWLSFLKLRGSYAITGSDGVGDYQYLSRWGSADPNGFMALLHDYNGVRSFTSLQPINQDYRWESNTQSDIELNAGFLQNKITVGINYYRKRSGNQITQLPTPLFSGFSSVVANWNDVIVQNSGVEGTLEARLISRPDWSWSFNFNIGTVRNRLVSYPGIESSPYATQYKVGRSLNTQYLTHFLGVDPLTGRYSYEDFSKDGLVTQSYYVPPGTYNDDRYIELDLRPAFQGGFGTDLRYKNISLGLLFSYVKQVAVDPFMAVNPGGMNNLVFPAAFRNNTWRKPGDNARYGRLSTINGNGKGIAGPSDGDYADASYIRLNNIQLSYAFPDKILKKAGMTSCYLSIVAQNIFTITKYKGIDPEIPDLSTLPRPRLINANLTFTF